MEMRGFVYLNECVSNVYASTDIRPLTSLPFFFFGAALAACKVFEIAIDILTVTILAQGKFAPSLPGLVGPEDIPPALETLETDMNKFKGLHRGVYQVGGRGPDSSVRPCHASCLSALSALFLEHTFTALLPRYIYR